VDNLLDEYLDAGIHAVIWNGTDDRGQKAASGMYFYRITFNGRESLTKKMVLLK
jgi:flagellar hook assembly protein FlgD